MNDFTADALSGLVTACFFRTWIVLGIVGVVFYLRRDVTVERKWFPRYAILAGGLFVFFSSTLMVLQSRSFSVLGMLVIVVPLVALITYLSIKLTRFCDKCWATVYDHNWFSPTKFCSKCGAELFSAKQEAVNDL